MRLDFRQPLESETEFTRRFPDDLFVSTSYKDLVHLAERLDNIDAVIATGSDNTARYFEYYFRSIPRIIRRNRSSCAILSGEESPDDLSALGSDVFSYFGLGCRNVSKLYVPTGYDFTILLQAWEKFNTVRHHHKYANNYDYQKSILIVNQIPFFDNGFVLLVNDPSLVSPISVLYFEYYNDSGDVQKKIESHSGKIQCLVAAHKRIRGSVAFGEAQFPEVTDYADKVDTLKFLVENQGVPFPDAH